MKKAPVADLIRKAGFRATLPRIELLVYLQKTKQPQSILEIADGLHGVMDQVTIYRIVGAFTRSGLLREVDLRMGRPCYEIADAYDHHHVVCTGCERVEDFTGCDAERLGERALQQVKGFSRITSHSLEFFGLCKACAKSFSSKENLI